MLKSPRQRVVKCNMPTEILDFVAYRTPDTDMVTNGDLVHAFGLPVDAGHRRGKLSQAHPGHEQRLIEAGGLELVRGEQPAVGEPGAALAWSYLPPGGRLRARRNPRFWYLLDIIPR